MRSEKVFLVHPTVNQRFDKEYRNSKINPAIIIIVVPEFAKKEASKCQQT